MSMLDRMLGTPSDADFQRMYDEATPAQRAAFNRRHRNMLIVAIVIKSAIIVGLIAWGIRGWFH